jgi:hypothetical protein
MGGEPDLLAEAERIAELAFDEGCELLVIGALALAAHRYVRTTADIDLAGDVDLSLLETLAGRLRENGYEVELRTPDAADPLGGVLDIHSTAGLVQIISFADRFPAVIRDGLRDADLLVHEKSRLRILPLRYLVVLKLYAGGLKSKADILEVLSRNPEEDLDEIETLCQQYRLPGFEEIRRELRR